LYQVDAWLLSTLIVAGLVFLYTERENVETHKHSVDSLTDAFSEFVKTIAHTLILQQCLSYLFLLSEVAAENACYGARTAEVIEKLISKDETSVYKFNQVLR
jgi:hypothetical protein